MGTVLIALAMILFLTDGVNAIKYQCINYDEGYNATVAANVMRYGRYRISCPARITFYNLITTGQAVLLPTALLYKIFGISSTTSTIVALLYGTADIFLFWRLLTRCLPGQKAKHILSALLTYGILMTDKLFLDVSRHLLGESAALCFLLGFFLFFIDYRETGRRKDLIWAGTMVSFAFLTKSSTIFFAVSLSGMVLIEMFLTRKAGCRDEKWYFAVFR